MKKQNIGWVAASAALACSLFLLAACGGGGGGGGGGDSTTAAVVVPDCKSMLGKTVASGDIGLATTGVIVTAATLVPAAAALGEYCEVSGEIRPVDATAQSILFSIALPSRWNGKAIHSGGSGLDGTVPDTAGNLVESSPPLARGYAVFAGDSGHQAPGSDFFDAGFALNAEMLRNYGTDAVKKTRDAATRLVREYYGAAPSKTYFLGGSKGGHEGMVAMQRWPQDYDGMVLFYPAHAFTSLLMTWQQASRAVHLDNGKGFLSLAKLQALQNAELAACDALDGAADGIVSNLAACSFRAASLRCAGGADTGDACLSDAQITAVQTLKGRTNFPYAMKSGATSYSGFNVSTGYVQTGGFGSSPDFPIPSIPFNLGAMAGVADTLVRNFILRDRNANSLTLDPLDPGQFTARIQEVSGIMDASSTDIQTFMQKGKWILVQGLSDGLVAPGATSEYYDALVARFGKTQVDAFMRFYTIPGFGHGTGLFDATGMKTLDALEQWVESGTPPGAQAVADANAPGRTRPLCLYPTWPRYKGIGDMNAAASFDCVQN